MIDMDIRYNEADATRIRRRLRSIPEKIYRQFGDAAYSAAGIIVNHAKSLAPYKTGALRSSITRYERSYRFGGKTIQGSRAIVWVGADHAVFVEYPTIQTPANPFLKRAIARAQSSVTNRIVSIMRSRAATL